MDREAVTAPVAMSIAMALFLSLFAAVALNTDRVGDGDAAEASDSARMRAQAQNLLDIMLKSPGYSADGLDWVTPGVDDDREDSLVRLGLREAGEGRLSWDKFENLRLAPYAIDVDDDYVNYEEARAALGFDESGLGFHIRAKPSLKSVQEILANGERDPNMKVTYLADSTESGVEPPPPEVVFEPSCTNAGDGTYTIQATVKNDGGAATQFSAYVTINPPGGGNGDKRTEWVYGPVVAAGDPVTLATSVPIDTDYCDVGAVLTFDVWDPSKRLVTTETTLGASVGGTDHGHDLFVDPSKSYYVEDSEVVVTYDGEGLSDSEDLTFLILNAVGGTVAGPISFTAGNSNSRSITIGAGATGERSIAMNLPAGSYTARLVVHTTLVVEDQVHIFASGSEPGNFAGGTSELTDGAVAEVAFLNDLVEQFCPFVHDGTMVLDPSITHDPRCNFGGFQLGDVIPDQKRDMDDEMPKRLLDSNGDPTYEHVSTLVVGSNVDHQAMTSASAKHAVRDWVLGGGTLIAFGSSEQAVQWLQPIFHSGIDPSGGGTGTPDADHPLLQVSDTLDWDSYDDHERVWTLQENGGVSSADKFTFVITGEASNEGVLTVSDPGAYGEGTIILTTWMPYDLFGDGSDPGKEGIKVVNNMLMQSYRGLFLDYGPPLPDGQAVVPASGKAQVFHPELGRLVSLDVTLFVFEQA